MNRPAFLLLLTIVIAGCAAAGAGVEPPNKVASNSNRGSSTSDAPIDPDTAPLPDEPKSTILDPKNPAPPAASVATTAAPPASSSASTAGTGGTAKPKAPTTPPTAKPAAPAVDNDCGSKENPCPMQKLMRGSMSAAASAEALEAAFNRVAGLSPNGGWSWTAIAKKGAELAKGGDVAGSKGQCKACHDLYKEPYKQQYRGKKI